MMEKVKLCTVIEKPISGEWGDDIGATKIIRTTNFTNNGTLNLKDVVKRNISDDKIVRKRLLPGDTIIEKSGGGPKQPVGRVVYFNENDIFLCNNFTSILRPLSNVDSKYLFWFLFNNHLNGRTLSYQNKTTGIINLKLTNYIEDIQIPLPDLATQKAIAAKLDKADEIRQLNKKLIEQYDALTQSLFLDMFGDPVKNEKGWEMKILKEVLDLITYGLTVRPNYIANGIPLISAREIRSGVINFKDAPKISEYDFLNLSLKARPKINDILFSKTGTIGLSAIVESNNNFAITQNCARLSFKIDKVNSFFMLEQLRNDRFLMLTKNLAKGNAVKDLQLGDFSKMKIILPPLTLQNEFAVRVKAIEVQKALAQQALQQSEDLFNSLLQESFK